MIVIYKIQFLNFIHFVVNLIFSDLFIYLNLIILADLKILRPMYCYSLYQKQLLVFMVDFPNKSPPYIKHFGSFQ